MGKNIDGYTPGGPKLRSIAMRIENINYQTYLEEQIKEQTASITANKKFLQSIIDYSGDFICVIDENYNIIEINRAALKLFNLTKPLQNKKCYTLLHNRKGPCENCLGRKAFAGGPSENSILPFPDKKHPQAWYDISVFPIKNSDGNVTSIIKAGRNITELKKLQNNLQHMVTTKELLLKEIHHRVKNSLHIVTSILILQLAQFQEEKIQTALETVIDKINSMAVVYQLLHQAEAQDTLRFRPFIQKLIANLTGTFDTETKIEITTQIEDLHLCTDSAIPIALIINELITNAVKHAFPAATHGTIHITAQSTSDGQIELSVQDNGTGLPKSSDYETSDSLGMGLIHGLAKQIFATLTVTVEQGTKFTLTFPQKTAQYYQK